MSNIMLSSISKKYQNDALAVDNLNIEIEKGEFIVLVGPSGCGKTTTLRMIAGLEEITDGILTFDNKIMNNYAPGERKIGMVFQSYALYPHKNVYENLAFGLKKAKVPKGKIEKIIYATAEMLGLDRLLKRKPKHLSGGQRQRVALARAIVKEPDIFLFDEPLSNLDASLRVSTRKEIAKLHQRLQATMIYVTHDQVEAMTLGTRIAVMNKGKLEQIDTPTTIYQHPRNIFVASFIGTPQINLLDATVEIKDSTPIIQCVNHIWKLPKNKEEKLCKYNGQKVIVGLRPEDLYIAEEENGKVKGLIQNIEYHGSETIIFCKTEVGEITVKLDRYIPYCLGDSIKLGFENKKLHIFDATTEQNIF
ncbi:MAG: ABC transporter ATP-binding protein [Bacillus sp. (in: firmicutes)]